uniref:Uncharacterized protein n=1 Tax=Ditylenchus dipsaci TaxID=166011 RepID=A0A915E141_9BILA
MNENFDYDLLMSDEEDLRNVLRDASDEEQYSDEEEQQRTRRVSLLFAQNKRRKGCTRRLTLIHKFYYCAKSKSGTISRNLWIQVSSLSTPERSASKVERLKQERLQESIRTFSGTDLISGLQKITRTLRNVEEEAGERHGQAAMAHGEMNDGGTTMNTRRRRSRN